MGPPNEEDRKAILKEITKEMHLDPEFDCSLIAEATWGCNSVSSLFSLLAQANVNAFGEGKPMAMRHVLAAIETAREGIEVEDLSTEEEKLFLASHEAGHALVAHLVGVKVLWVSTRPRSTGNEFQGGRTYNGVNLRIYLRRKF